MEIVAILRTLEYIVGGTEAEMNAWPWMAYLRIYSQSRRSYFVCGATIIGLQTILTAAHCVDKRQRLVPYEITAGCTDRTNWRFCQKRTHETLKAIQHEQYSFPNYDIAIVTTTSPFRLNKNRLQPICLPSYQPFYKEDVNMFITGWGSDERGLLPQHLKQASVHTVTNDDCARAYGVSSSYFPKTIMCVHGITGATCQGDSGGFLGMQYKSDGRWYQYGVTSFGHRSGCSAKDTFPEGFTQTFNTNYAKMSDWIRKNAFN